MCMHRLVSSGHRRIGMLSGSPALLTARERLEGYLEVVRESGGREMPALVRHGDIPFGGVIQPRLTVLAQPAYEMGKRGAELLIARVDGKEKSPEPVRIELNPELIVRRRTAARR